MNSGPFRAAEICRRGKPQGIEIAGSALSNIKS
jgi:hypothetical protein